jgi:hypothetical protein
MAEENKLGYNHRINQWTKDGVCLLTNTNYSALITGLQSLLVKRWQQETGMENLTQEAWSAIQVEAFKRIERLYE